MDEVVLSVGAGGLIPTLIAALSAWFSVTFSHRVDKRALDSTLTEDVSDVARAPEHSRAQPGAEAAATDPSGSRAGSATTAWTGPRADGTLPSDCAPASHTISTGDHFVAGRRRTEEYLRQMRSAMAQSTAFFWAYVISGCCGVVVVLAAASMVAFGNRDAAAATSIMGAVPVGITALFYKRSTDLDKIVGENLERLGRADELAAANRAAHEVATRMGAGADHDRLLAMIGVRQLFPSATPTDVADLLRIVPPPAVSGDEGGHPPADRGEARSAPV